MTREELRSAILSEFDEAAFETQENPDIESFASRADSVMALFDRYEAEAWKPGREAEYYKQYLVEVECNGFREVCVAIRSEEARLWKKDDGSYVRVLRFRELPRPQKEQQ